MASDTAGVADAEQLETLVVNIEALLRTVAPQDLAGAPIYILLTSELPPELRIARDVYGLTGERLDAAMRPAIEASGKWAGRGAGFILNDLQMLASVQDHQLGDPELEAELFEERMIATALHEISHLLQRLRDLSAPTEFQLLTTTLGMGEYRRPFAERSPEIRFALPYTGHEVWFIRTLAHAIFRAEQWATISRVPRSVAFGHNRYELSRLESYEDSLGDELFAFDGSFAELDAMPLPEATRELWRADVARFYQSLPTVEDRLCALTTGMVPVP